MLLLGVVAAVCAAFGATALGNVVKAEEEPKTFTVTSVGGGAQDNFNRYLVWLGESGSFEYAGIPTPITASVNGEDKKLDLHNDTDAKQVALLVPYEIAPKEAKNTVVLKKDTIIGDYKLTEDATIVLDNGSITLAKPELKFTVTSVGGGAQDTRYLVWLGESGSFEYTGIPTPITASVNGEDKTIELYNDTGAKQVALLVPYEIAPKEAKNTVVLKKDTVIGDYKLSDDATIVLDNGNITLAKPEIEFEIDNFEGGAQDNFNRYLVWMLGNVPFVSESDPAPVTVSVNGEDKSLELYNDKENDKLAMVVPYEIAPKEGRTEITIKQDTKIADYVVKEEVTVIIDNGVIKKKIVLTDITFSLQKDAEGKITSAAQETSDLYRYLIRIQTDLDGLTDTMWNGNVCYIDEGTEKEKRIPIYYLGGLTGDPSAEGYDGTAILGIIEFDDIIKGARTSSEIGKHSVTIRAGSELGGGYAVKEDLKFYIGNEYVAENEGDIPELPLGIYRSIKGLENKTIDFESQKIEDYIANSSVVKLKADAEKDTDGNVVLKSGDSAGYCKSIKMIGEKAEPQIKFRSAYNGGDIYLVMEVRSQLDNGNYWLTEGAPTVRFRYNGAAADSTELRECLWFDFFNDGLKGVPQYVIYGNNEFKLEQGDFFVEFGAVNKADAAGNEGFVFYVKVTQGEKVAYGECHMTGDYNVSDSGDVSIYISPAPTALLVDYSGWETLDVKDSVIKSVDEEREIDGETRKIGAMSLYSPKIRRAENVDEYDISDIVPVGDGVTYTKIDGDTESASQSMINATDVSAKNGGYIVKMRIKFTGDDFGLTFAFRGKNTLAKSGYKLIIADDVVIIGSITKASPFVPDTEYDIEIGCIDYFIADERVAAGTIVYLKVGDTLVAEDNIEKKTGLGSYFCALIEGAGGSKVTVSSAKAAGERKAYELTTKANKTIVASGKKATLSYESNMNTAYDKVSYEVVKGDARIDGDGLYSNTDGEIVVRVKIENEFGTFYGSELTINKGSEEKPTESGCFGSENGCGSSAASAAAMCGLLFAATAVIAKKRKK